MRKKRKIQILLLICFLLAVSPIQYLSATGINELQQNIQQNEQRLNELSDKLGALEDERSVIEEEVDDANAELINLYTMISVLEEQITLKEGEIKTKEGEIGEATKEYELALEKENEQYEAMKVRIRYLYEEGNASYAELLISSQGFGELLNHAEFIEAVYEYDRKKLIEFQETKKLIAELKEKLQSDKAILDEQMASLEEDKSQLSGQQTYLKGILEEKKAKSANYAAEIAAAKSQAQAYKNQIAADNKQIAKIREEERKRQEAANRANGQTTAAPTGSMSAGNQSEKIANARQIVASSSGSETGKSLANYACGFAGNPYVPGGTSLTNGADCSGFIYRLYADYGYKVPRTSYSLRSAGTEVSLAQAQPGDVVCYEGHVGLYIGNGMIVHASSQKTGIKFSNAQYRQILCIRRLL